MKRLLALLFTLTLLLGCAAAETTAEPATTHRIERKTFPFYDKSKTEIWREDFPLYFVDGVEDLPFVELNDWRDLLVRFKGPGKDKPDNGYKLTVQVDETGNRVTFIREQEGITMTVAFDTGTISFYDYAAFIQEAGTPYLDFAAFPETDKDGQPFIMSRTGSRNLYGDYTVLDLKEYGIPMIAQDGKYLLPMQTLAAFTLNTSIDSTGLYYNGQAVFLNDISQMVSPKKNFNKALNQSGLLTPELKQKIESFESTKEEKQQFILDELSKMSDQGEALVEEYKQQMEDSLYVLYASAPKAKRSEELTEYGYRELCLELNCFYGLKDAHNITDFRTFLLQSDLGINLSDPDPEKADKAILDMTQVWFDDGHSGFISSSYLAEKDPQSEVGYSIQGSSAVKRTIQAARAEVPEASLPYYEVGDTAYVTFDTFILTLDEEEEIADYYALAENGTLPNDTLGIIIQAHQQITREDSPVKNVVLDLSANGGGMVPAAYYTLAWFLGEASVSVRNTFTGSQSTAKIRADVNLDRQFDENDTLAGRGLHLFCLTSSKSFSCGNLVPWAFKADGNVTLIGKATGGGSCLVGFNTTAWGTSYQYSGFNRVSFVKNGSYYDVDRGVDPDFIIMDYEHFYDRDALTEFIHGLF